MNNTLLRIFVLASIAGCTADLKNTPISLNNKPNIAVTVPMSSAASPGNVAKSNQKPVINQFSANPTIATSKDDKITFTVVATDSDGDPLSYTWTATKGLLSSTTGQVTSWSPKRTDGELENGVATISVIVNDGRQIETASVNIQIEAGKATVDKGSETRNAQNEALQKKVDEIAEQLKNTPAAIPGAQPVNNLPVSVPTVMMSVPPAVINSPLPIPSATTSTIPKPAPGPSVSAPVVVSTPTPTPTPLPTLAPPTGLSSSNITSTGFTLDWSAVSEATAYNVYKDGNKVWNGLNFTRLVFGDLSASTSYSIQVSAVNSAGESVKSSGLNVTTLAPASTVLVSTLAGSGVAGFADGTGTVTQFKSPSWIGVDGSGNTYIADSSNHRIRKVTPAGVVTTLAGNGSNGLSEGTGISAQFSYPRGVAVDGNGNVYVASASRISKINASGVVTILAGSGTNWSNDGTGTAASFDSPEGVAVDGSGYIYVTEPDRIRKITPAGVVTTLAGSGGQGFADGIGTSAKFNNPTGVTVDISGNIYVADSGNSRIRKITPGGTVSTLAGSGISGWGDGSAMSAHFNRPFSVAVDGNGNIYVADTDNARVRKITPAGTVSTLAGNFPGYADGSGTAAQFNNPIGVAVDSNGIVYVVDAANHRIRKITLQ